MEELALFVQLRALVLETEPEQIAELQRVTNITQEDAMTYFEKVYDWGDKTKATIDAQPHPLNKESLIKGYLRQTLNTPILTPRPEA
jgi:hypothetical protein